MTQEETPLTNKESREMIIQANIAGRGLTSDLADDIIRKMSEHIALSVETTVNGKIKRIDNKLDEHIRTVNEYILHDMEWKKEFSPMLSSFMSLGKSGKILFQLILGISALGGAILAIRNLLK